MCLCIIYLLSHRSLHIFYMNKDVVIIIIIMYHNWHQIMVLHKDYKILVIGIR